MASQAAIEALSELMQSGVQAGAFPGGVALLAFRRQKGMVRAAASAGILAPGESKVTLDTPYDLASLTKPFVATTALRLVQRGVLDLHTAAARYIPELEGTHGGEATLHALLSHRAGLSPWGSLYKDVQAFGSADARRFMLREAATRSDPEPKAEGSTYSDLGYMLAGEAIARAARCSLAEAVRREVTEPLGISLDVFYAAALSEGALLGLSVRAAPTERCSVRGVVVRGQVHDENCMAYGGISGHAGLFGTARGVLSFGEAMLDAVQGRSTWLDRALIQYALRPQPGAGYALGWDTKAVEGSSAGSRFSAQSFGHLGFTGTSIWCDPLNEVCAVLLTNRVHPTRDNILIRQFRPRFHDAAMGIALG
jgi:CubicO group peptidase (beta-lactamase class C family)